MATTGEKLNNFGYAKTLEGFETALAEGTIDENSIVFIEETYQLWTHGQFFQFESVSDE